MSLYKVTTESAYVICSCGADREIALGDLEAEVGNVALPACGECGARLTLAVNYFTDDWDRLSSGIKERNIINQALHKRLCEAGKMTDEMKVEKVPDGLYRFVPDEDVVEAQLHPLYAGAKAKREEKLNPKPKKPRQSRGKKKRK